MNKKLWHKGNLKRPHGIKSNGLFNKQTKSVPTDNPHLGTEQLETIKQYISTYKREKNRKPTQVHLNKRFNINATKSFYLNLI